MPNPGDYLPFPSYEYFPRPCDQSKPQSQSNFAPQSNQIPQGYLSPQDAPPQQQNRIVVGPSSMKTTFYDPRLGAAPEEPQDQQVGVALPSTPSGCKCDPEVFDELLHHMHSGYTQYHNGMMKLFDTFKTKADCPNGARGASSSIDFDPRLCADRNLVIVTPGLAELCQQHNEAIVPKTGGQYMSYADYIRMMQNVNFNPGTIISSSQDVPSGDVVGAPWRPQDNEMKNQKMLEQLKNSRPPANELIVQPADTLEEEPPTVEAAPKAPIHFRIKDLLGNLKKH